MPDATAGIASGLYWVATGKMPIDDIEDDELKSKPEDEDLDISLKDRK